MHTQYEQDLLLNLFSTDDAARLDAARRIVTEIDIEKEDWEPFTDVRGTVVDVLDAAFQPERASADDLAKALAPLAKRAEAMEPGDEDEVRRIVDESRTAVSIAAAKSGFGSECRWGGYDFYLGNDFRLVANEQMLAVSDFLMAVYDASRSPFRKLDLSNDIVRRLLQAASSQTQATIG